MIVILPIPMEFSVVLSRIPRVADRVTVAWVFYWSMVGLLDVPSWDYSDDQLSEYIRNSYWSSAYEMFLQSEMDAAETPADEAEYERKFSLFDDFMNTVDSYSNWFRLLNDFRESVMVSGKVDQITEEGCDDVHIFLHRQNVHLVIPN